MIESRNVMSFGKKGNYLVFVFFISIPGMLEEMGISRLRLWCRESLLTAKSISRKSGFAKPILWGLELFLQFCIWMHILSVSLSLCQVRRCYCWCETTYFSCSSKMAKCNIDINVTVMLFCDFIFFVCVLVCFVFNRYLERFSSVALPHHIPVFHWKETQACSSLEINVWSGQVCVWMTVWCSVELMSHMLYKACEYPSKTLHFSCVESPHSFTYLTQKMHTSC